ncbi:OmpA family protein [Acidisphaera sp. S103]|uniref:OmpA family protein n=1 Tax=Acidisphaera sp. S103 TaxID=1747223 RepID=UPI001C203BA9|nr:OmpA family protein [Acidisphaera sp. S103]
MRRFPERLAGIGLLAVFGLAACAGHTGLTAAQIAVLRQNGFHQIDDGWELGLSDKILFASNSDKLNPVTETSMGKLGHELLSVQIGHLGVEGHTDSYGTDAYNNDLSLRRAQAVAVVLESAGMQAGNIRVRGLGKQDPVADNNTPAGQSENRRVAIVVPSDQ